MKKVLVVWNHHGHNLSVLHKAADLLRAHDQKAVVVTFINDYPDDVELNTKSIANLEKDVTDVLGADRVEECLIAKGNKAAWIIDYCRDHDIDLVIKPWRRSKDNFYTESDWQLVRHLHADLLLVQAGRWEGYHRILAAVDIHKPSVVQKRVNKRVMELAGFWAQSRESALDVVHCIKMSKVALELDIVEQVEIENKRTSQRHDKLQSLVDSLPVEVSQLHLLAGRPEQVIAKVARKIHSDLIVLGSQGKRALGNLYLGNTAKRIMEHLATDILIVRDVGSD